MRNISDSALNFLTQQQGLEPINLVQVIWTDSVNIFYGDTSIPEFGIKGKIVELANLENVVNIAGSSASQSVSITLDDVDGTIKDIYDYNDIHKRPVRIYQWFRGLHIDDAFIIFEGELSSPIVWKEADRTFSFEVVSKLEDQEVGFSPEEGAFDEIPDDLIGKAWPLPFGTCLQVPAIALDQLPKGVTGEDQGVPDPSIDKQIADLQKRIYDLGVLAQISFTYALEAYNQSHYDSNGNYQLERQDQQLESQGDNYTDQGNKYLVEMAQAQIDLGNLEATRQAQIQHKKISILVHGGECFPQGQQINARIGGVSHTGTMQGSNFAVDEVVHPAVEGLLVPNLQTIPVESSTTRGGQDVIQKLGFYWLPPGQVFKIESDMPVHYLVAMLPVQVLNVWSMYNFQDTHILTVVPSDFYTVTTQDFGPIVATIIEFSRPLSHLQDGWSDEIFVDVQSPVGPNTVDIIIWLITNYTTLGWDFTSFTDTRDRLAPFPSNFCLLDRPNIVKLLADIAYQARCAIWMKDNVFYMRYLVDQPIPVDTITESDVMLNSLEIHNTETENLVTKLTASYKVSYESNIRPNKIILRNNTTKYGIHEEEVNWFIYNVPELVDLAATYWLIRKSNSWKTVKFRTPLHKLRLETFDPILLDFSHKYASSQPVVGIIESVKFNSSDLTLDFDVWIPVRMGDMTQYQFAWPIDSDVFVWPDNVDFQGSNGQATGDLVNRICAPGITYIVKRAPKRGRSGTSNPGTRDPGGTVIVTPRIEGLPTNRGQQPQFDYTYRQYRSVDPVAVPTASMTAPGKIIDGTGPGYKVTFYWKGLANQPQTTTAKNVDPTQDPVAAGTWVMVSVVVWTVPGESTGSPTVTKTEKYFLPAAGKPGVFPGQILSGMGNTYSVKVFLNGLSNPGVTKTVQQLQIDPADQIPVDSWVMVGEMPTNDGSKKYFMQVPIWYE